MNFAIEVLARLTYSPDTVAFCITMGSVWVDVRAFQCHCHGAPNGSMVAICVGAVIVSSYLQRCSRSTPSRQLTLIIERRQHLMLPSLNRPAHIVVASAINRPPFVCKVARGTEMQALDQSPQRRAAAKRALQQLQSADGGNLDVAVQQRGCMRVESSGREHEAQRGRDVEGERRLSGCIHSCCWALTGEGEDALLKLIWETPEVLKRRAAACGCGG